jgi:putative hydrolase of HD superfamily
MALDISKRLDQQINFMLELDKMKNIYRQTYVLYEDRKENDAEHSWHLAIAAILLSEYANNEIDLIKIMKMVLVHDIVEIDAGDTYCYDADGNSTKSQREEKAAHRIFGLLPDDQHDEFYALWREFEDSKTPEARFAAVLDRIQPLLLNYTKHGISWKEHGIHKDQVLNRNKAYFGESAELSHLIKAIINDAVSEGFLKS